MRTTHVVVLPYHQKWKADFEAIRKEIAAAAGDWILGIEQQSSAACLWKAFPQSRALIST